MSKLKERKVTLENQKIQIEAQFHRVLGALDILDEMIKEESKETKESGNGTKKKASK